MGNCYREGRGGRKEVRGEARVVGRMRIIIIGLESKRGLP